MKQRTFLTIAFGFFGGVFLHSIWGSALHLEIRQIFFIALASVMLFFIAHIPKRTFSVGVLIALVGLFGALGFWRSTQALAENGSELLRENAGKKVTLIGTIVEAPDTRTFNTRLVVRGESVSVNDEPYSVDEKVLITTHPFGNLQYGDRVSATGRLRQPEVFETDTGRTFDYVNYLAKDTIFHLMSRADVVVLESGEGSLIKRAMLSLKKTLVSKIDEQFAQPEGALLAGVLFGEQAGLGEKLQMYFRRTGVIHIVVLSGFNVTIVALFIIWFFSQFLQKRVALIASILGVILFAILVGAGATIIRASIMAILAILARVLSRDADTGRALTLAGMLMVWYSPRILVFDISFQLSFLATLGVMYVTPVLESWFLWVTESFTLRETVVSTFAAQIFVLPFLLYSIGEFSIVAPLVNVLVVPLVSITMLLGFLSALFGLISQLLGALLMIPTYLILHMQIQFVEIFGELSFASVVIPAFPFWVVVVSYALLIFWLLRCRTAVQLHSS